MNAQHIEKKFLNLPVVPRYRSLTGTDEFVREIDYDMTTVAGRVAWFCDEFELERPTLELDLECNDHPEAVLITEELGQWAIESGTSLDFLFAGSVRSCVEAYRRDNLQTLELVKTMKKMEPEVKNGFHAMIKAVVQQGVPLGEAHAVFEQIVQEWRATSEPEPHKVSS